MDGLNPYDPTRFQEEEPVAETYTGRPAVDAEVPELEQEVTVRSAAEREAIIKEDADVAAKARAFGFSESDAKQFAEISAAQAKPATTSDAQAPADNTAKIAEQYGFSPEDAKEMAQVSASFAKKPEDTEADDGSVLGDTGKNAKYLGRNFLLTFGKGGATLLGLSGSLWGSLADSVAELVTGEEQTTYRDRIFAGMDQILDDVSGSLDLTKEEQANATFANKVAWGAGGLAANITMALAGGPIAGTTAASVTAGVERARSLIRDEGVDTATAAKIAATEAFSTAVETALPVTKLAWKAKIALNAASGAVIGAVVDQINNQIFGDEYKRLQVNPLDPERMGLNATVGGIGGGVGALATRNAGKETLAPNKVAEGRQDVDDAGNIVDVKTGKIVKTKAELDSELGVTPEAETPTPDQPPTKPAPRYSDDEIKTLVKGQYKLVDVPGEVMTIVDRDGARVSDDLKARLIDDYNTEKIFLNTKDGSFVTKPAADPKLALRDSTEQPAPVTPVKPADATPVLAEVQSTITAPAKDAGALPARPEDAGEQVASINPPLEAPVSPAKSVETIVPKVEAIVPKVEAIPPKPETIPPVAETTPPKQENLADVRETLSALKSKPADALSPDELRMALLRNEVTALKNKRAYEFDEKLPVQTFVDVQGLKFANDRFGHDAGDNLIRHIGDTIHEVAGDKSYHFSGDEFGFQSRTQAEADATSAKINELLSQRKIQMEDADGKYEYTPRVRFGHGATLKEADLAANVARRPGGEEGRKGEDARAKVPDDFAPVIAARNNNTDPAAIPEKKVVDDYFVSRETLPLEQALTYKPSDEALAPDAQLVRNVAEAVSKLTVGQKNLPNIEIDVRREPTLGMERTSGAYFPETNTAVLFPSRIDPKHVEATALHEIFHHDIFTAVEPSRVKQILANARLNKEVRELEQRWLKNNSFGDSRVTRDMATEEALAQIASRGQKSTVIDRVVTSVRSGLRKAFPTLKVTDGEIRSLISSLRNAEVRFTGDGALKQAGQRIEPSFLIDRDASDSRKPFKPNDERPYDSIKRGPENLINRLKRYNVGEYQKLKKQEPGIPIDDAEIRAVDDFIEFLGPRIVGDVGFSIRSKDTSSLGQYSYGQRLVTLFKSAIETGQVSRTAVHELWHATERQLTKTERDAIQSEFERGVKKFIKKNEWAKPFLKDGNLSKTELDVFESIDFIKKYPSSHSLKIKYRKSSGGKLTLVSRTYGDDNADYRLTDKSEYFAETMSDHYTGHKDRAEKIFQYFDEGKHMRAVWEHMKAIMDKIVTSVANKFGYKSTDKVFASFAKGRDNVVETIPGSDGDGARRVANAPPAPERNEPRFSQDGDNQPPVAVPSPKKPGFISKKKGQAEDARAVLQDQDLPIRRMQEAIIKRGGKLEEGDDYYDARNKIASKVTVDMEDNYNPLFDKFAKQLRETGISLKEIGDYRTALHALERNPTIAARNKKLGRFQDGSGSGMTTQKAQTIIALAKRDPERLKALDSLSDTMSEVTAKRRELAVKYGLLTPEEIAAFPKWKHYVPLKDVPDDIEAGSRFAFGLNEKAALGRESEAQNPAIQIFNDLATTIRRGRKNEAEQALLSLALKNPDPKMYVVDPKPTKLVLGDDGQVKIANDTFANSGDNVHFIKREGDIWKVVFKDAEVARAAKPIETPKWVNSFALKWSRLVGSNLTRYSLNFISGNKVRDMQTAGGYLYVKEGPAIAKRFIANQMPTMRALYQYGKSGKASNPEMQKYIEEWRAGGGKTAGIAAVDPEVLERNLRIEAGQYNNTVEAVFRSLEKGTVKPAAKFLENVGALLEDSTRVAVYAAARQTGKSQKDAATLAKDAPTNFDRRGRARWFGSVYMFANPAIQDSRNLIHAAKTSPKRATAMISGLIGAGILTSLYNQMASPVDEDGMSEWAKKNLLTSRSTGRNLTLQSPSGSGRSGKLPLAHGWRAAFDAGQMIHLASIGAISPTDASTKMATSVIDTFSPLGIAASEDAGKNIMNLVAPTLLDQLVDLWAKESSLGTPMDRRASVGSFDKIKDDQRAATYFDFNSATEPGKLIARTLNKASGGSDAREGWVNFSGGQIDYLAKNYITGYADLARGVSLLTKAKEDIRASDVPIAGVFLESKPDYRLDQSIFYKNLGKVKGELLDAPDKAKLIQLEKEAGRVTKKAAAIRDEIEILRKKKDKIALGQARVKEKELSKLFMGYNKSFNEAKKVNSELR